MKRISLLFCCLIIATSLKAQQRIISLSGTLSEMLCDLGLESQIAGVDVTSTYPETLKKKPRVGHNRNISAESIIALQPTIVLGLQDQQDEKLSEQLRAAGVKTRFFKQDMSPTGVKKLLNELAAAVGQSEKARNLESRFDKAMRSLDITKSKKKVLFIYARGTGTMMVSGTGTAMEKMIILAGAQNAINDFPDFKPLTAESLIAANPDAILLFSSGLQSLNGPEGLLKVPGIAQTTAGKNKKIISMDGELLSAFSLRLPIAIQELNQKIQ